VTRSQQIQDGNTAIRNLDNIKALLAKGGVSIIMTYKDDDEKTTIKAALEKSLPMYLEREAEWSAK
jgi:hypothetical protein